MGCRFAFMVRCQMEVARSCVPTAQPDRPGCACGLIGCQVPSHRFRSQVTTGTPDDVMSVLIVRIPCVQCVGALVHPRDSEPTLH